MLIKNVTMLLRCMLNKTVTMLELFKTATMLHWWCMLVKTIKLLVCMLIKTVAMLKLLQCCCGKC